MIVTQSLFDRQPGQLWWKHKHKPLQISIIEKINMKIINIILICFATFLAGLSLSILTPFYPTEALSKGVTVSQTGIVLSSVFVATIIFTPVCGKYMQLLGARKFLILGSLVVGVGNAAFGLLQNVEHHLMFLVLSILINVVIAMGGSCVAPAAYTLAGNQLSEEHRGKGIALAETCYGIGTMFGPTAGGVLFDYGGFLLPFAVTGVMMISVSVLSVFFLEDCRSEEEEDGHQISVTWWEILSAPGVGVSVLALMMAGVGWAWYSASLEPFLKHKYNLSASQTGLVFMAFGLSYTVFTPLIGYMTDKGMDGLLAMIIGNFIIFLGFVFLGPAPPLKMIASVNITITALGLQGLGSAFTYIGTLLYMMKAVLDSGLPDKEQTRGMVSSLWVIADCVGGYIGSSLGSMAYDKYGFESGTMMVGGVMLITVIMMVIYLGVKMTRVRMVNSYQRETQKLLVNKATRENNNYGTQTIEV